MPFWLFCYIIMVICLEAKFHFISPSVWQSLWSVVIIHYCCHSVCCTFFLQLSATISSMLDNMQPLAHPKSYSRKSSSANWMEFSAMTKERALWRRPAARAHQWEVHHARPRSSPSILKPSAYSRVLILVLKCTLSTSEVRFSFSVNCYMLSEISL